MGAFSAEGNFAAYFDHVVLHAVASHHVADHVASVSFGDRAEIEFCGGRFFDYASLFDGASVDSHRFHYRVNLLLGWCVVDFFIFAESPQFDKRSYRGVECPGAYAVYCL